MLCAGQVYRSTVTVQDQDSAPSTVTLAITKPDGTPVIPAPTIGAPVQAGRDYTYTYDYTLPSAGLFRFAWSTQGPGTAPPPDYVNVRDFISITGLAEIKAHLNITGTSSDDELAGFMQAATELVESKAGICVRRTVTARVSEGSRELVLPHYPVLSVTSVTSVWAGGPSWATADLIVDTDAGTVSQAAWGWPFSMGPWDVVYVAGRQQIPERFIHAAKEQVRHLWDTQRGAAPPGVLAGEEVFTSTAGFTFSVPRRVLELLEQDMVPSS